MENSYSEIFSLYFNIMFREIASAWRYLLQFPSEFIAFGWFLFCWFGYNLISDNLVKSSRSLSARMHLYRIQWMTAILTRENRVVDANIINNLQQSISFFASTSILIIAGLLAVLGASDTALSIVKQLPFAIKTSKILWYLKVMILIGMFIYAFFKYTWALRQLNYASVLIGAMPYKAGVGAESFIPAARRAAIVCTLAAKHLNRGLRTYYFAIAALVWFINPWLFIIASGLVVMIMYRREYRSHTVHILNMPGEEPLIPKPPENNTAPQLPSDSA
jgi:uncharacterized membrane protein